VVANALTVASPIRNPVKLPGPLATANKSMSRIDKSNFDKISLMSLSKVFE
jgi:hypothetical protein